MAMPVDDTDVLLAALGAALQARRDRQSAEQSLASVRISEAFAFHKLEQVLTAYQSAAAPVRAVHQVRGL